MALLNFKGKNAVWNHHLSVPYQILEKDKKMSVEGKNEDENLIIEADNLIALKSLLPKYQGQIKCIYIDPPYNIGNENWIYNDKSNSPLIKDWIGKTVGADDLTRHDKWLCMMTPRLKLLQELLSNDGVIFISIDDNEVHYLKSIMNEIYREENFIAQLVWANKEGGGSSDSKHFRIKHEYILVYANNIESAKIAGVQIGNVDRYTLSDKYVKTRGKHYLQKLGMGTIQYSKSLDYPMKTPDGRFVTPSENNKGKKACWRWSKKKLDWGIENDFIVFKKDKNGIWQVYTKQYLNCDNNGNLIDRTQRPFGVIDNFSSTQASKELQELFDGNSYFDYPKPVGLIQYVLEIVTSNNDIILDSFAGSGTTAQAVLELNEEDGGDRKFILVQLPEKIEKDKPAYNAGFRWIHEITRERVKRVINRNKLSGGFSYMKLGPQIDADSILTGNLPTYKDFAKYVYYLATGKTMEDEKTINEKAYFVGKINGETVYLIYEKDSDRLKKLAITLDWAEKVNKKDKGNKIVYAPACFLDEEHLEKFNISFVSIPYNLFEKNK